MTCNGEGEKAVAKTSFKCNKVTVSHDEDIWDLLSFLGNKVGNNWSIDQLST